MNYLHSRKPYFKDFSASMKMITELIKLYLYLVKLQFIVVMKNCSFCILLPIFNIFYVYVYVYVCMYTYMCICVCVLSFFFPFSTPFSHFIYSYIYLFIHLFFFHFLKFFALLQYFIVCLIIHSLAC